MILVLKGGVQRLSCALCALDTSPSLARKWALFECSEHSARKEALPYTPTPKHSMQKKVANWL